jgi:YfiH family protein
VDQPWRHSKKPQADAMVTTRPGLALGILTADCVPVLFADTSARVIGAAHSGWKGLLAGVLERTIEVMQAQGAQSISAAIGPCIGGRSYEVGTELREQFLAASAEYAAYFRPAPRDGHFLFDIGGLACARLEKAGLSNINRLENDTYIEEDAFFSYRRTTHRKEPDYGRQVSAILLSNNG